MKKKKDNNPDKFNVVGADNTRIINAKKRQMNVFSFFILVVIILIGINLIMVYRFNTNLYEVIYNKIINSIENDNLGNSSQEIVNKVDTTNTESENILANTTSVSDILIKTKNNVYAISETASDDQMTFYELDNSKEKSILYLYFEKGSTSDYDGINNFYIDIDLVDNEDKSVTNLLTKDLYLLQIESLEFDKVDVTKNNSLQLTINGQSDAGYIFKKVYNINLKTDLLEKKDLITDIKREEYSWDGLNFSIINKNNVSESSTEYVNTEFIENYLIYKTETQLGNKIVKVNEISLSETDNVNKLDLNTYIASLKEVVKLGDYPILDKYDLDLLNTSGEVTETISISFNQMVEFAKGNDITVNEKVYNKKDYAFDGNHINIVNVKNTKIAGLDSIEFDSEYNGEYNNHNIIFMNNNKIYTISYSDKDGAFGNEEFDEEVATFLDSIKVEIN